MTRRSAVLGYVILIVLLTAGAAQSLAGSNTVTTDDIVDHNITAADLGTNSVTRPALGDNAVGTNEVANNSLTGADINESTLGLPGGIRATAVSAGGTRLLGVGTASHTGTGSYAVDYGSSLAGCIAQATPGYTQGTDFVVDPNATQIHTTVATGPNSSVVNVVVATGTGTATDSPFFLTVICP